HTQYSQTTPFSLGNIPQSLSVQPHSPAPVPVPSLIFQAWCHDATDLGQSPPWSQMGASPTASPNTRCVQM
ncbi:unnamed protein product, partial [Coccothraustes coccothraustes]